MVKQKNDDENFSALVFKLPKLCLYKKFEKQIRHVQYLKDHLVNLHIQRQVWNLEYKGKKVIVIFSCFTVTTVILPSKMQIAE